MSRLEPSSLPQLVRRLIGIYVNFITTQDYFTMSQKTDHPIKENEKAPAFSLSNAQGQTVQLSDFKGQYVVVYFYPKDDTPGCTKEACGFRDLNTEFEAKNAVILGVSPDEALSHQAFIDKYELNFQLLCDPGKTMMENYGAWGEKNMYGKISMGVIRSTVLLDPKGTVVKLWKRVSKADQHPSKVLEILNKHAASA